MGIMSRGIRTTDRPRPPTVAEIENDLIAVVNTDIALVAGERHLPSLVSTNLQSLEANSSSSLNTSTSSTEGLEISKSQIQESYGNVLRLLELYSNLKDSPAELKEKMTKLKAIGDEMSESISQLKSLSETIVQVKSHGLKKDHVSAKSFKSEGKEKSKVKRKT